jgi:gluconate 5-dehydrogenase
VKVKEDDLFNLEGYISVVTGAAGGLGESIACGLAGYGSSVVLLDLDLARVRKVREKVEKEGVKALDLQCDVTSYSQVETALEEAMKAFNKVDILVNCAGITARGRAENISIEDWNRVISVNLTGVFFCCQVFGRQFIKQSKGSIINIASVVGQRGLFHPLDLASPYCVSKGGVIQLTRALAAEWAKYNVRVNAIAPTYFLTDMTRPLLENPEFSEYLRWKIPLGRPGKPEEIVGPVVFLASEASSMITGHVLNVDGGWTAI